MGHNDERAGAASAIDPDWPIDGTRFSLRSESLAVSRDVLAENQDILSASMPVSANRVGPWADAIALFALGQFVMVMMVLPKSIRRGVLHYAQSNPDGFLCARLREYMGIYMDWRLEHEQRKERLLDLSRNLEMRRRSG